MAVWDYLESMNDVRLKPKLLRSLIRNSVPDEKRPFPPPSQLSAVLSYVKTHGLLSEPLYGTPADAKRMESWKSAVDAWVDHLLSLVSSKSPDKCWAGICLLGVTCEECGFDRFLAAYPVWFQKLLSKIQPPSDSHFIKVATCASLSDLFTRLAAISNVKKDAVSIAGKVIQPVLQLLSEDGTNAVWVGAIDLLCTLITLFPSSIHRHYERVEAVVVSKIMSVECSENMSKKVALCLSLLPKVRGDDDSWSLMMKKIMISINVHLNEPFQGLEEDAKSSGIMRQLVPPGKDPPPPLGGQSIPGEASRQATKMLQELVVPRVSRLMQCCCMILTNPYPVQVTIPISPLLALVGRVLMVDGSLHESLSPITTAMHQELLCSELPTLHLNSLDLLIAVLKAVRSQLFLPHAANVVRLITEHFRKATLPRVRIKVYTVMQILLISMGVGMAQYISEEVINNAFADLKYFRSHTRGSGFSNLQSLQATSEVVQRSGGHRKRKHASGPSEEHQNGVNVEVDNVNRKAIVPLDLQTAALGALEALITVGGSLKPESWRPDVDLLLITVATNACDGGWAKEENDSVTMTEDSSSTEGNFQLAALKAVLASLLSPSHVRPPFLSRGLELFRKGKQVTGTKMATFCAHALLALEVLIHPRALPFVDSPVSTNSNLHNGFGQHFQEITSPSSQKPSVPPFSRGLDLDDDDNDDDLYNSWLGDGDEIEVDANNREKHMEEKHMEGSKQPVEVSRDDTMVEKPFVVVSAFDHEAAEGMITVSPVVEMACESREENMAEQEAKSVDNFAGGEDAAFLGDVIPGDNNAPGEEGLGRDLNKDGITSTTGDVPKNGNGMVSSNDPDSPRSDSLPDIVDCDPDSE